MTVAKKNAAKQLKKWHVRKLTVEKKSEPNSVKLKQMRLIKMSVAKKIGAKQLKKMVPYKNVCGEKNVSQTQRFFFRIV